MNFLHLRVEDLIPHRGAMCWIDQLVSADDDHVVVQTQVRPEHPLVQTDGVPGWAGIEYMAQTIAVWAGVQALKRGQSIKPGFLVGSRRYRCQRAHFWLGQRLTVKAQRELMGDNGLGLFSCTIYDQDEELAAATVSVFEPPDPQAYLEKQ